MNELQRHASTISLKTLVEAIVARPGRVRVWTPAGAPAAVVKLLKGIVEWVTDEPTLEGGIVEDLARAIEKCGEDREALRDLSVELRAFALRYEPRPERVAVTEQEAVVLWAIDAMQEEGGHGIRL